MERFTSCYQGIFADEEVRSGFDEIDVAGRERSFPFTWFQVSWGDAHGSLKHVRRITCML
jgi:hypothetical protein